MRGVCMAMSVLLSGLGAGWSQAPDYESFEAGLPAHFSAPRPESLSLSDRHSKQGTYSLRWDFLPGEVLTIRHGIGEVTRRGGFNDRASFAVWLYCEQPADGALVFEFREGERVTGSFRFPLQFSGWRQGRPFFHAFPSGAPTSQVDSIAVVAPAAGGKGTVFFDLIKYNTLTYPSRDLDPEKEARWQRPVPDEGRFPRPAAVTEGELAGIRALLAPPPAGGIGEAAVKSLCDRAAALGIVREEHGVRGGPGIDRLLQYCCDFGELGAKDQEYWPDEHGPTWGGVEGPRRLSSLGLDLANAYQAADDPGQRQRLAEAFLLLEEHLYDQGMQAGAGFHWNWWYGGSWADAVYLMREPLAAAGHLARQCDYYLWNWGGGVVLAAGDPPSHMDFYLLDVPRLLRACLLQPEPAEQVRWLRAFQAMLERSILLPNGALKLDGSAYHHGGNYFHYAFAAVPGLAETLRQLSATPWRLSAQAHERVRRAALAQRLFCNKLEEPLSTRGRMPFTEYSLRILPRGLDALARSGTPDGTEQIDREAAAAYLRLVPRAGWQEPYRTLDLLPEPDPSGCFAMPYAALLSHRRDNWLVSIHGQSKYCWGTERQGKVNCFSLFQGLGSLEVMAGGDPVTAAASGRQAAGWDWRHYEGTTAPELPLPMIDTQWTTAYSPEVFVGGLSHRGREGVFAMKVNQPLPGQKVLTGRKSWFLFGERVLCLGSDISCSQGGYRTQTTLCQKGLRQSESGVLPATLLDGTPLALLPVERDPDPTQPHWFLDVQGTGYYLPAVQRVHLARRHQKSRDYTDQNDTEGDFLTAWIDHGFAPTDGAYEYLLVVRATPEGMAKVAAEPPYRVLQRHARAHLVRDDATRCWGCAFFAPQQVAPQAVAGEALQVAAVDRACLIMQETLPDGRLALTVADPDLNLVQGVSQARALRVTLRGKWRLQEATGRLCAWDVPEAGKAVRALPGGGPDTVLEIACQHGASYEVRLAPAE